MRKTIAALSLLFISCTLWAGGDILWLMFPNWNSVNDLSQYLERLELDGYRVLTEEDTQEELEAFAVQDLSLSLESLSPDEGIEVLDEMIIDFNFEDGGLTLLDFTMDAFSPNFWGQHLAEIEILMREELGWSESMFRAWLIRMIEREDNGQYIQVFVFCIIFNGCKRI